jgi:hypothetical protein
MRFLRSIASWLRRLTTSIDNQTPDVIRIGVILFGLQAMGLAAWDALYLKHQYDMMNYCGGAAALLAAAGAALRMKRKDEPGAD